MRILFIGAIEFSRHCLEQILEQGGDVVGVFTPTAECALGNADYSDLCEVAEFYEVPVFRFCKVNEQETIERMRELDPDVIFVLGFSQLVSSKVLAIPPLGCIGSHPALLPVHRGRHPLIWTLVEGLEEGGLTFFYLEEGADSGDILWQKPFAVTLEDDASTVYEKIEALATEAIAELLPALAMGAAPRRPQDASRATYWRKRTEADGEIDWQGPSLRAYNLIRALTRPYVGAHTWMGVHKIIVWRSRLIDGQEAPPAPAAAPGTIVAARGGTLRVRTGDGWLELTEFTVADGEPISLRAGGRLGRTAVMA